MFTMAKIRNGSTYLESHLGANDYYSKGERVAGLWIGLGAKQLGLRGEVLPNQFEALRVNENPLSGLRLTPRTKQDRVAFFDFQCSAQKSVSIMAVLAGDERLRAAHARCSLMALGELEKFACRQRNNAIERKNEITGNICAAAFTHDASRALDPQLHTHFVVANATRAGDQWFALNEHLMLEAIRYAGKVYQNEMAREVRALGYGIRQVREDGQVTGFEIEGVSQELCDRFSKRRKEIEEGIEAFKETYHREPTRKEIAAITRESRPAELREITTTNVRQLQFGQLEAEEWAHLQSVQRQAREQTALPLTFSDAERTALKAGVEHLFERKSVLREHEILAEALNQNLGSLDLAKLTSLAKAEKAGLVRLVEDAAEPLRSDYATRHGLASELWSVEFVKRTNGTCQPLNPEFEPSETLYPQQKEAVKSILENENRVQCFRGVAGSGKTTTLSEVRRGLEAAGHKLFTVAPTASASKTLRESGFKEATTLADFLQNGSKTLDLTNGILVCDEAGLQSNRDGEAVLRLAGRNNMRVIFVGDVLQHVSVEAGDFLRVLEDHSPLSKCELTEILRQQHDGYLEAVSRMAEGDPRAGLGKLDDLGWIKEGQSHYIKNAAEDYLTLSKGGQQMEKCMVVAPTWEENRLVTNDIRTGLKERDILGEVRGLLPIQPSLNWTKAQKADSRSYEVGQIVTFTKTNTKWKAGESAIVQRVSSDGVRVASASKESYLPLSRPDSFDVGFGADVEICRGDKILILANRKKLGLVNGQVLTVENVQNGAMQTKEGVTVPASFRQWTHGYAVTSEKGQSRTCDHLVMLGTQPSAKALYVSLSRGRLSCVLHTPDKALLMSRMPEGSRRAALDVLAVAPEASSPLLARPKAWQAAQFRSRKARARVSRREEQMRGQVRRWRGERQVASEIQKKAQKPSRVSAPSLNPQAIQSITNRNPVTVCTYDRHNHDRKTHAHLETLL